MEPFKLAGERLRGATDPHTWWLLNMTASIVVIGGLVL